MAGIVCDVADMGARCGTLDVPPLIPERSSLQLRLRVPFEIVEAQGGQGTLKDDTAVQIYGP